MKKILCDKIARIIRARKKLERILEVKITNRGKEVYLNGKPEKEYIAEKVIDALNFGFPFSTVLLIKEQEMEFETINIKDYTKRKNLKEIRARIIGTQGKTLKTISDLTECFLELKDNEVGIIGDPEFMKNAQEAVISIIQGAKQTNVYKHLEKTRPRPLGDLGLK